MYACYESVHLLLAECNPKPYLPFTSLVVCKISVYWYKISTLCLVNSCAILFSVWHSCAFQNSRSRWRATFLPPRISCLHPNSPSLWREPSNAGMCVVFDHLCQTHLSPSSKLGLLQSPTSNRWPRVCEQQRPSQTERRRCRQLKAAAAPSPLLLLQPQRSSGRGFQEEAKGSVRLLLLLLLLLRRRFSFCAFSHKGGGYTTPRLKKHIQDIWKSRTDNSWIKT